MCANSWPLHASLLSFPGAVFVENITLSRKKAHCSAGLGKHFPFWYSMNYSCSIIWQNGKGYMQLIDISHYLHLKVTKSLNHRTAVVGKDLWRLSSPIKSWQPAAIYNQVNLIKMSQCFLLNCQRALSQTSKFCHDSLKLRQKPLFFLCRSFCHQDDIKKIYLYIYIFIYLYIYMYLLSASRRILLEGSEMLINFLKCLLKPILEFCQQPGT